MLLKKKYPFVQKLRIIQLFEGDLNGGLKYLLGRRLMRHIHEAKIIDKEIYGSRIGKTGAEALIGLQLLADYYRIWKINTAIIFNDVDGCFDRIPPNLAELALRRIGCPKSIAVAHTKLQRKMKHFVKMAIGISKGYNQYGRQLSKVERQGLILILVGLIGGIGQGGGGSPIIWMVVLMIMLAGYKETNKGTEMRDPVTGNKIMSWIISYIDDNSIVRHFRDSATLTEIISEMTNSIQEWQKLLQITGGDLSLGKCKISIMKWVYLGPRGTPTMVSMEKMPGTIRAKSVFEKFRVFELERLNPWQAEKILGVHLPMDGTMDIEYTKREAKLMAFGDKMYKAPLTNYEAHIAMETRYRPMALYPFPVTMFSTDQLDRMQQKAIYKMLPKLGINRHAPQAMIFGPRRYGGRQITDLQVEQPLSNIMATIGHMRRMDEVGKALIITLRATQVKVGTATPFFCLDPMDHEYVTNNTRWQYTWEKMYELKITVKIQNFWVPRTGKRNDVNIMEAAVKDKHYQGKEKYCIISINRCRLYCKVFYLSEMTTNGKKVDPKYLNGEKVNEQGQVMIPEMRKPTKLEWSEWKNFIFQNFLYGAYNVQPDIGVVNEMGTCWEDISEIERLERVEGAETLIETIMNFPSELQGIV